MLSAATVFNLYKVGEEFSYKIRIDTRASTPQIGSLNSVEKVVIFLYVTTVKMDFGNTKFLFKKN